LYLYEDTGDFGYRRFDDISANTGLDRRTVRRACRSLTRKGLAEYGRGLWTEDGEPAGSGYRAKSPILCNGTAISRKT